MYGTLSHVARQLDQQFRFSRRAQRLTSAEQRLFFADQPSALDDANVTVEDCWLEVDFTPGWRAAYRLVPWGGQPVIAEVRVFPSDNYPGRSAGTWRAEVLGVRAGGAVPIRQTPPGWKDPVHCPAVRQGLTARLVKQIPLGAHHKHAAAFMAGLHRRGVVWPDVLAASGFTERRLATETPPRTTRPARPDRFYATIARAYVARIAAGSRRPVADLATRLELDDSVVRDAIHEARMRGLLTPGRQGVPGGQLTTRAKQVLKKRGTR